MDQHDWDFKPWFSKDEVDTVWDLDIKPMPNFWLTLKPLPGTSGLAHLPKNVEPVFITARVPTAGMSPREQTCTWLRQNFYITFPFVLVVDNPTEKIPLMKNLGLDNFIDDKTSTIKQLHNAGFRTYAKLTPYNSAESFPENVIPVESLDEYLALELKR